MTAVPYGKDMLQIDKHAREPLWMRGASEVSPSSRHGSGRDFFHPLKCFAVGENSAAVKWINNHPAFISFDPHQKMPGRIHTLDLQIQSLRNGFVDQRQSNRDATALIEHGREIAIP